MVVLHFFISFPIPFVSLEGELSIYRRGRIAIRPYTCVIRTLANIHINHVNTQKKRRHGHGMREFACVVGAKSASWRSGVCDAIRPHHNLPILQNSPILQIHLYFQLPLMGGRIALKGRANCPQWMGELQFAPTRVFSGCWQISCNYV